MNNLSEEQMDSFREVLSVLLNGEEEEVEGEEYIIAGNGYEWFFQPQLRAMKRVALGIQVAPMFDAGEDEQGRIIVVTVDGDMLRVPTEMIVKIGYH